MSLSSTKSINKYASALFQVSKERDKIDVVREHLYILQSLISSYRAHFTFCLNEVVKIVSNSEKIDKIARNFFVLLAKRGMVRKIGKIYSKYMEFVDADIEKKVARVKFSGNLQDSEKENLKLFLEKELKSKVDVSYCFDPEIILGFEIEVDGIYIVSSYQDKIRRLLSAKDALVNVMEKNLNQKIKDMLSV